MTHERKNHDAPGRPTDALATDPAPAARFWRSIEERGNAALVEEADEHEFLESSFDSATRRQFLTLLGASLALAGATGCGEPPSEKIVPYVQQPEDIIPGRPLYYATALPLGGFGTGALVESHMGRPTKIEGNPDHPA